MNASETLVCKKFCGSRKNASKIQVVAWVSGINKYLFKKKKKEKKRLGGRETSTSNVHAD